MASERHWHWTFTGYNSGLPPLNTSRDVIRVTVLGFLCEADARVAAQDIVQREHFDLFCVIECAECGYKQSTVDALASMVKQS